MYRSARLAAALLVLAFAAALGVSACGSGDGSSSSGDPSALLKDTFGSDHPIRSGRVDATLDVDLEGLAQLTQPISLHLSGPFQSHGGKSLPDFALQLDFQSGQQPFTIGAVFAQGGAYLSLEGKAFNMGDDLYQAFKRSYEQAKGGSAAAGSSTLSALGISPLRWLKDPTAQGSEDIGGTQTDHVAAQVDVPKLLDDVSTLLGKAKGVTAAGGSATGTEVPTQLTADQRDAIARSVKSAKFDLWTGRKDHTLRKIALDVEVAVPEDLQARASGLKRGHVIFQLSIAQLNQAQKVTKPADAQPLSQLRSTLQQLGLVGSSSGSSSSATPDATAAPAPTPTTTTAPAAPAPAPATGPQADYQQCLTDAGEDLAKVQECGKLLR